jgi:hypothetical protein
VPGAASTENASASMTAIENTRLTDVKVFISSSFAWLDGSAGGLLEKLMGAGKNQKIR